MSHKANKELPGAVQPLAEPTLGQLWALCSIGCPLFTILLHIFAASRKIVNVYRANTCCTFNANFRDKAILWQPGLLTTDAINTIYLF